MSNSKFLPSVYTIRGLPAASGCVFLCPRSAARWLRERGYQGDFEIAPAEVIYYGSDSNMQMKTTEDLIRERDAAKAPVL